MQTLALLLGRPHLSGLLGRRVASVAPDVGGSELLIETNGRPIGYDVVPHGEHFEIVQEGRGLRLPHSSRKYIAAGRRPEASQLRIPGGSFANFSLPGRVLSARIDLGEEPMRGCIASLYAVAAPGPCGFSECSNDTWHGGMRADNPVPQLDLFMVNSYRSLHQSHACRRPWHAGNCDVNGTLGYAFDGAGDEFGPGPQFMINTLRPFHIHVAFHSARRMIQTVYHQEGRRIQRANSEYAKDIWEDLARGPTLALSYWSDQLREGTNYSRFQCPYTVTLSNLRVLELWQPRPALRLSTTLLVALAELALFLLVICGLVCYCRRRRARPPLRGRVQSAGARSPRRLVPLAPISES